MFVIFKGDKRKEQKTMTKQQVKKAVKNQMTANQMIDQIVAKRESAFDRGCLGESRKQSKEVELLLYRGSLQQMTLSDLIKWYLDEFSCPIA